VVCHLSPEVVPIRVLDEVLAAIVQPELVKHTNQGRAVPRAKADEPAKSPFGVFWSRGPPASRCTR
jgi:hypothetical protein